MSSEIPNDETANDAPANDAPERRVTVVIPAYNEQESVTHLADCLAEFKTQSAGQYELKFVIVDDASQDLSLIHI